MDTERIKLLIVDDDAAFLSDLISLLPDRYEAVTAASGKEALSAFESGYFDAVLLDIDLGAGLDGFEVLDRIHGFDPTLPVIMVTQHASTGHAVTALKKGAVDFIDKKPDLETLEKLIVRALDQQRMTMVNKSLRSDLDNRTGPMIGKSESMQKLRREIEHAAKVPSPVLIVGETGTGKELVAREIHKRSCPDSPFVPINCAAVPRDLFEARLFGSERGAYTGADKSMQGVFELAGDGVLFLDEITEIDSNLQAKLLRAIEERIFQRLGSSKNIKFKGKILASTNQDIQKAIENNTLRKDLYYRFSTFIIQVLPLRRRRSDILFLARHFVRRKAIELKKQEPELGGDAITLLCSYDWPGNVRELENAVEAFVVRGSFSLPAVTDGEPEKIRIDEGIYTLDYSEAKNTVLKRFKRQYVEAVLASFDGNITEAAGHMGITRFGLQKILKEIKQ